MLITKEGKFWIFRPKSAPVCLGLDSSILDEVIAEAHRGRYAGVFGHLTMGFRSDNIDPLEAFPELQKVWFWDVNLKSIDGVYAHRNIRYFGILGKRPALDFSLFQNLDTVVWDHKPKDRGLGGANTVNTLHVWHYNPKHKTFEGLDLPDNITELQFNWANPASLTGLKSLPTVKSLEFHRCRNLNDLGLIPSIFPNLERLIVQSSGKDFAVNTASLARSLPNLKFASLSEDIYHPAKN